MNQVKLKAICYSKKTRMKTDRVGLTINKANHDTPPQIVRTHLLTGSGMPARELMT